MKIGESISILRSVALERLRLNDLAGRTATIIEINKGVDGSVHGCWVELDGEPYETEKEWYIPQSSIGEWKI